MVWVCKWPDYKARFQSFGGNGGEYGCLQSRALGYGTASPSVLGSCSESFREPIRDFHDLLRQKPPSVDIVKGGVQSQCPP
jgi:hypothetical protein